MGNKYSHFQLLSNEPLDFYGVKIYKPTLKEIAEIGFDNFQRGTSFITMSVLDIAAFYEKQLIGGDVPEPLDFITSNAAGNMINFLELQMAFLTYLKKPVEISDNTIIILDEDTSKNFVLDKSNFSEFQSVILAINKIEDDPDEREINSPNERLKQRFIRARLKKKQYKMRKKASENEDTIQFDQIITSLCAYGIGYTLFNVWDLTIYQLYDQFERIRKKDNFEKDYAALLAGADSKKIKLKNWMK